MLFKKKIVFTEGMNETLCSFDEIPWFSCCGVPYDKPSYYPYLQEKDPKRAEKLLLHTKNYSGTVCLTNLFKEGICRADTFILQTAGWKFYQNEFMPCVEASWRTYEKRALKAYLEMHRPILFNELVLSDKLFEHCAEIDETARNRMELIVRSLAEQNGVTEQLKAENQMEWVRQMNACKAQAEEIVKVELIYD